MARRGTKFTSFHVAQAVCSASRAALLTGCYPNRLGIHGALGPNQKIGLHPEEMTIAEVLKTRGYATAMFGKWHLGRPAELLPTTQGFDEYFGLPYSNDMWPKHPSAAKGTYPPLPLIEGDRVIEEMPDQTQLTRRYTERAVDFIGRSAGKPFFLYLAHSMPHVPIFASAAWKGKSAAGLYGDVVEELDDSVGRILAALKQHGIEQDTLVIFFSDNGPFLSYGNHAGSAAPLREGKLTSYEGGVRVPCLMRWPGRIPAGTVCAEPVVEFDLLPTLAALCGGELSKAKIDGQNVTPLLEGREGATSPHEALFFYSGDELQAVRAGRWKLHFDHDYISTDGEVGRDGKPGRFGRLKPQSITQSGVSGIATRHGYVVKRQTKALYDLQADPGEQTDVSAAHPDIVQQLETHAQAMRSDLGDALTKTKATGARAVGKD